MNSKPETRNPKLDDPQAGAPNPKLIGLGIDLVEVKRIEKAVNKWGDRFLNKIFTPTELTYCLNKAKPAEHLAASFAGKEAVVKALGFLCPWKDIEIRRIKTGKPEVSLEGRAKKLAAQGQVLITLTHTAQFGMAQAVYVRANSQLANRE